MAADNLAYVGPSDHYMCGYRDGLYLILCDNPHPADSIAASEYDEGFYDAQADIIAGVALAGSVAIPSFPATLSA